MKKKSLTRQNYKNVNYAEENLRFFTSLPVDELLEQLSTTENGLTSNEVEDRQDTFGKNVITIGNNNTVFHRLKEAVINPFNIILIFIAIITYITDVAMSSEPDYLTVLIILSLVLISSVVAFVQDQRSNAAVESLSKMISNKADVWRDNKVTEVAMDEIVPGDIVRLSAGDMLPGDVRFLMTKDTFVSQAALTGESNPVEKFYNPKKSSKESFTDLKNI